MSNKFIKSPVLFLLGVLYNHNCSYNTYTTKTTTASAISFVMSTSSSFPQRVIEPINLSKQLNFTCTQIQSNAMSNWNLGPIGTFKVTPAQYIVSDHAQAWPRSENHRQGWECTNTYGYGGCHPIFFWWTNSIDYGKDAHVHIFHP